MLPKAHQLVVGGLGQERMNVQNQRRTAHGALVRAQRDRLASEPEGAATRAALALLQTRFVHTNHKEEKSALRFWAKQASESSVPRQGRIGLCWLRLRGTRAALERECSQVEKVNARMAVQMKCLRAAWDQTRLQ